MILFTLCLYTRPNKTVFEYTTMYNIIIHRYIINGGNYTVIYKDNTLYSIGTYIICYTIDVHKKNSTNVYIYTYF